MKNLSFFALFLLLIFSCKQDDSQKQLLIGKWQAKSWKVGGRESGRLAESVRFEFKADNTYTASYGEQSEKGTFRLNNDKLYTTAEDVNKIEKMVKFSTISADTLVMDMNRIGDSEQLVLVKK